MAIELRKTGISVLGEVPWGTHFCHFYKTKQDLLDTVVPYLKAGLESKEFCLWIVSNPDPITIEEAKSALGQAVPDLDRHLQAGNIEILDALEWYLEKNAFRSERVISAWDAKLERALALGYEGMRVSGDTFWLKDGDWKDFCAYEKGINDSITDRQINLMCTYSLAKSGAAEVLDVVQIHRFATARRQGQWEVIETPELIQAKAEIKRLNNQLQRVRERTRTSPLILRYGVAVLSVAAAVIITLWLRMEIGQPSTPIVGLFLCAVMFSAWFGGFRPGLLAIVLSLLAFDYYFVPPIYSFGMELKEIPRLLVFALSAIFVGSLSVAQKNTTESLKRARDVLDETVEELKRSNQALRTENAERKRAESLLHAKEQEFRAIVENAPDQILRYDREFRRLYVNPAVAKFYGMSAETLIGEPLGSGIPEAGLAVKDEELARVRQQIAAVFKTGRNQDYEMTWTMPTGRTYFAIRLFPELDLDGSVVNVLGISRDITERKLAEEELKKEKETLEKIFDNIPVMIGFVGDDGRVKLVNPEWERTIGWTVKELQEQNVDIFAEAYPDPLYRQEVLDFVAASSGEWVDLKIKVRDGHVIDAACAVVQLADGTRVAIAQDITERKSAEEHIRATSEHLRALSARLQSAKEEEDIRIARELHDEMGSALTSLRWELERFDTTVSEVGDQPRLQALRTKIKDMMSLTEIIIGTMRRIASELRPSILDDLGLVAAIEWQGQQFQLRTGIVCHFDRTLEEVELNEEQSTAVFRIFQETLTNILRHSQATTVDIQMNKEDGYFVLSVSDNGKGITESEKSEQQSFGILGMRERAHLIKGELDIQGVEGQGTVVTVRVPISGEESASALTH